MTASILFAAVSTVAGVLGAYRQIQGNDKAHADYTEPHDHILYRVMELDRRVDAEWVAAAKAGSAALATRQSLVRKAWIDSLGGFPAEKCPLNAKVTGVVKREGYRVEKVMFESRPNHHVTASVYVPENEKFSAPYPAVAVGCGHSSEGKMTFNYQRPGVIGARNGFVVIIYDPIDQGERCQRRGHKDLRRCPNPCGEHNRVGYRAMLLGWNTAQFRIYDGMRAIDYLCERKDVDASKIAVTGHSGGGTESAYIMALDPRVKAACPSGFITSMRELALLCGPQDAEQKFFGQIVNGVNHLGMLMLRAGKCAEMPLTTHSDFFPFMGATDTRDKAREAFSALGIGDSFDFVHASGPHLWPESSQQAEYLWFRKHLKGEKSVWKGYDPIRDQKQNVGFAYADNKTDCGLMGLKDRISSPTGCVIDLPGERTVYDLMRDELKRLDAKRETVSAATVAKLTGIRRGLTADSLYRRDFSITNAKASAVSVYRNDDGLVIPLYVFRPQTKSSELPLMIVSSETDSTKLSGKVEAELAKGRAVAVAELRLFGRGAKFSKRNFYGNRDPDEMVAAMMEWLGESMIARRAEDLELATKAAAELLGYDGKFALFAEGRAAIPAAHVYFLGKDRFASITVERAPLSWRKLFEDDDLAYRFADVIHGALRAYDWVDLLH